jgi:acetyltransferase-like isoleucine patch superfamily enzyme
MSAIVRILVFPATLGWKALRRALMLLFRGRFARCGRNVLFSPFDSFDYAHIEVGDDVFIGAGAVFHATLSRITIGNKVMFGPQVLIMGGDHNTGEVGRYMFDVKEKLPENDLPVFIEDDVWIGARAILLKGVTIGSGSIVAAGSVVTRSMPGNSIVAGVPARVVRSRFEPDALARHMAILGREGNP